MKTKVHISIILPTLNERENVRYLVPEIIKIVTACKKLFEVIIVDDASTDGSNEIFFMLQKKYAMVHVFARHNQRGLGSAIGYGIQQAKGEVIIGMDADGNHDPKILPLLFNSCRGNRIVVASRFVPGGGMQEPGRYLASLLVNTLLQKLLSLSVRDCTSGYYSIRKNNLVNLGLSHIYFGYGDYHLRLLHRAMRKKYEMVEIPVMYNKRRYGHSKSQLFVMGVSYIVEAFRLRHSYEEI